MFEFIFPKPNIYKAYSKSNKVVFRLIILSILDYEIRDWKIVFMMVLGKHFIRNICKAFDLKLLATAEKMPQFSQAV
jgi:hypothetical protein